MDDKIKQKLIKVGGIALCILLVVGIGLRMSGEKPQEDKQNPQTVSEEKEAGIVIDIERGGDKEKSEIPAPLPDQTDKPEQQIQATPKKPEPPEKPQLPANADITNPEKQPEYPKENTTVKPPEKTVGNGSCPPGFENAPNLGPNQVTFAPDMYENGNKIGDM